MTEPARVGELLPGVLREVVDRAGPGYERWAELVAQAGYCAHPIRLRGRVEHADRGDRRDPHRLLDRAGAGRHAAQGVRQPPRVGLPLLLGDLPGRQLPAPGRRPARRQGRPRDGGLPSAAVRHLHRPQLRPGPHPQGAGTAGVPLPPLPARASCPHGRRLGCWHRHDEDDPRLGEPLCARCYQAGAQVLWNALAGGCGRGPPSTSIGALAQLVGLPRASCAGWSGCRSPRWPSTRSGAPSTSTLSSAWTRPPSARCPGCLAPPPAVHRRPARGRRTPGGPGCGVPCPPVDEDGRRYARWGEQLDVRNITRDDQAGSCRLSRWPATSPSTQPRAPRPSASPSTTASATTSLEHLDAAGPCGRARQGGWELGGRPSWRPAVAQVGAHARFRRPLVHQEPPLLDHLHRPAAGPHGLRQAPPGPRWRSPGCLGTARGRPGRGGRRLLGVRRLGLRNRGRALAGAIGCCSCSRTATDRQGGVDHHDRIRCCCMTSVGRGDR